MEDSTSKTQSSVSQRTISSVVQDFGSHDVFPSQSMHPFAADPESSVKILRDIIDATVQISGSLNSHASLPLSNLKLLSLFRQQTNISHTVHDADHVVRKTVEILRKRVGIVYGEDIPLDRSLVADWAISRLEAWAAAAGMEAFKDEERDGHLTMTLAGKVVVVDIDLSLDRQDPQNPSVSVSSVKTSYAVPNATTGPTSSHTAGSISLDGYLSDSLRDFFREVQKLEEDQDPEKSAHIGTQIGDSFKYLMMSDQLALHEGDNGLRWFNNVDLLAVEVEKFAAAEARAISGNMPCPLDILLMRGHGLPLPYLVLPSLSFLVHVSPLAYLTMLRKSENLPFSLEGPFLPRLDIPFSVLRSYVSSHPRPPGIAMASLVLSESDVALFSGHSSPVGMEALATRPTFSLVPEGEEKELHLPDVPPSMTQPRIASGFFLDFTDGGRSPGVVMSQSRMREIEMVLNPLGGMDMPNVSLMSFGSGSWVDMLLNPSQPRPIASEHYSALYVSPTSAHPPLQLRFTAPEEPGFRLEKVPVRSVKNVWGILEIVKEQCWLNEILLSCNWVPENAASDSQFLGQDTQSNSLEDDLEAVLTGTLAPRQIPVNVYVPTTPVPIFDAMSMSVPQRATKVVMTSPERPPISGLVEITVSYDSTSQRGVALSINGAMGADLKIDVLEEVCRRGGVLGLPGRVWAKGHGLS